MTILLNLATLKGGGGQNVGLNFVEAWERAPVPGVHLIFVVAKGSKLESRIREHGADIEVVPRNPLARMAFERLHGKRIILRWSVDAVYTLFGYGIYPRNMPQISGSADSNLYFPEVAFREAVGPMRAALFRLVDRYRVWALRRADGIVVENEAILKRARSLHGLANVTLIRPSIAEPVVADRFALPRIVPTNATKVLFFCGWQAHKRLNLVPDIAALARAVGASLHFVVTASPRDRSPVAAAFYKRARTLDVEADITLCGPVAKAEIGSLYEQMDVVVLLSELESFSNNIIEAWHYRRPLVVTDAAWSRAICRAGAVYAKPSPESVLSAIRAVVSDRDLRSDVVTSGASELARYPTVFDRTREEIDFVRTTWAAHA